MTLAPRNNLNSERNPRRLQGSKFAVCRPADGMSRPESERGPRRLHGRRGGRGEGEEAKGGVERLEVGGRQGVVGGRRAPLSSLQLCEEEKAVLMECRRNSLARGSRSGCTPCWPQDMLSVPPCRSAALSQLRCAAQDADWNRCRLPLPTQVPALSVPSSPPPRPCPSPRAAVVLRLLHRSGGSGLPGWHAVVPAPLPGEDHDSGALGSGRPTAATPDETVSLHCDARGNL